MQPQVHFHSLGHQAYEPVWRQQEALLKAAVDLKIARRKAGLEGTDRSDDPALDLPENHLFFVEHPHVLTLGKSGHEEHVVASPERLNQLGVSYYPINRGGDITYHGPGQLVGYPIVRLPEPFDVVAHVRRLEQALMQSCTELGLETTTIAGRSGVWVPADDRGPDRKVAAIGVRVARGVTQHGFALNVNCDLGAFDRIVPCGIRDAGVTSLAWEGLASLTVDDVRPVVRRHVTTVLTGVGSTS